MENVLNTFVKSLKHLKEHPILFVPNCIYFTATYTVSVFLAALYGVGLYYGLGDPNFWGDIYMGLNLVDLYYRLGDPFLVFLSLILIIGSIIFSSFTNAGIIGMSKDVIESGSTDLYRLFSYGKKYMVKLVIAFVLITLLRFVSALFWAPVIQIFTGSDYTVTDVMSALQNDPASLLPLLSILAIPALVALILTSLYLILISFMFYFISYIIVIDQSSVYKSYRKSFSYLRKRPLQISSFVLLMTIFGLIPNILTGFLVFYLPSSPSLSFLMILANICFSIFFVSVTSVWVSRFYMVLEKRTMPDNT